MPGYSFVNPYNFIPLPNTKTMAERKKGSLSGLITYNLYTKTPLFIPNTSSNRAFARPGENKDHKSYDFFSYTDLSGIQETPAPARPVIPGSEMRGVLRSNYEIITNSCMSSLDVNKVLSKRTMESFQAGLIKKNGEKGYQLFKAEDCLWRTEGANNTTIQNSMPEGTKVVFDTEEKKIGKTFAQNVAKYADSVPEGKSVGYLIKGAPGPGNHSGQPNAKVIPAQKHYAHIFRLKENAVCDLEDLSSLYKVLDQYYKNNRDDKSKNYAEYRTQLQNFEGGSGEEYFPVYYSKIDDATIYLSPACKTREVYKETLRTLAGSMIPCSSKNYLCPACSLFGTLADDGAVSSRIRVLDLKAEDKNNNKDYYLGTVTLKPLSSPKLSNVEFYLQRPEGADFWTYDYYIDSDGTVKRQPGTLSGRKFYWHNLDANDYSSEERTSQNITVRPVRDGITFKGKIYFEKISEKELRDLLFVIQAGDNGSLETKEHGLKIGAAKPLGFGSVAMKVTGVTLRSYEMDKENQTIKVINKPAGIDLQEVCDADDVCKREDFLTITNFQAVRGEIVGYPRTQNEDDEEGYQWFTWNHAKVKRKNGTRTLDLEKNGNNKMPTSRKEMIFRQYMEPMKPGLSVNIDE